MKIKVLTSCSEISIKMTEDLSPWVKPPMRILVYIISIIAIVVFSPFYPLFEYMSQKMQNAVHNLRNNLKVIWDTESRQAALSELRNVYEQVKAHHKRGEKYKTEKYGTFPSYCYMEVAELLYDYEIYLGNWDAAHTVCQEALEFFNYEELLTESPNRKWKKIEQKIITRNEHSFFNHYLEGWIVNKAKCLTKLEGEIKAKEYLLRFINPHNKGGPIKKYMNELKLNGG